MVDDREPQLVIDRDADPEFARFLDDRLYAFNVETSGIGDDELLAIVLRDAHGKPVGGACGWTWGGTCYIRHLFLPLEMRNQGLGTRIMRALEQEATARGCVQMLLETHDFQAPDFYRKLGFAIVGTIDDYPRGHRYHSMLKRLR
jgi:GNAT superfamily N-acetyltransferase